MSSSDSEDDCYSNAASRLQKLKNCFTENRTEINNLLDDSTDIDNSVAKPTHDASTLSVEEDVSASLDKLIQEHEKSRPTTAEGLRRSSRKKGISPDIIDEESVSKPKRGRKSANTTTGGTRGRARQRLVQQSLESSISNTSARGRNKRRVPETRAPDVNIPTYSVGNTYDYPDQCEDQQLFSTKPSETVVIEEEDDDVNEEMSIKVYWRNADVFKFTVRRFQKVAQIYDYFSKKEGVQANKLLFTYEGRILSAEDTPDSISYSISKFIDGGIVQTMVSHTRNEEKPLDGIKIKFQCQNSKRPFETVIGMNEKFATAMTKCAEHFELCLDKLKFVFDGDVLNCKQTPKDCELEGGECIDVKTIK